MITNLVQPHGADVLQPVAAEVAEAVRPHQLSGGLGDKHLPAVTGRADPCAMCTSNPT